MAEFKREDTVLFYKVSGEGEPISPVHANKHLQPKEVQSLCLLYRFLSFISELSHSFKLALSY